MAISLELFKNQLDSLVDSVDAEMAEADRYEYVKAAVIAYSGDLPDTYTEDVSGDGGKYYAISSLTKWIEGISIITIIEYPAPDVASDEIPQYIEPKDIDQDYWDGETRYLFLPNHSPSATEDMRITYTTPYQWEVGGSEVEVNQASHGLAVDDWITGSGTSWSKTTDNSVFGALARVTTVIDGDNFKYKTLHVDVPQSHFFPVCYKAACIALQALAAKYAKASDTTVGADSTTHTSRTLEFSSRAKEFCKMYRSELGLDAESEVKPKSHGEFVEWGTGPGVGSRQNWLFWRER